MTVRRPPAQGRVVRPTVVAAGVAVPLLALGGVLLATGGDGGAPRAPTTTTTTLSTSTTSRGPEFERFAEDVEAAFSPLAGAIEQLVRGTTSWRGGSIDDAAFSRTVAATRAAVGEAATAVSAVEPLEIEPLALPLLTRAVALYGAGIDELDLALAQPRGDLRDELVLAAGRVRVLGDRAFDRSRDLTHGAREGSEGVVLHLPTEVPDWTDLGLAPGPPLTPARPAGPAGDPPERLEERPSQPEAAWMAALEQLDAPSGAAIVGATDAAELGALARRLEAAARALHAEPVPDGDRVRADRVALGWLVRAEAARARQLAALSVTGAEPVADRLLGVAADAAFAP